MTQTPQSNETWGITVRLGRYWLPNQDGLSRPHILLVVDGGGKALVQQIQPQPFHVEQVWQALEAALCNGPARRPRAVRFDQPDLHRSLVPRLEAAGVAAFCQPAAGDLERILVQLERSQSPIALLPPALVSVAGANKRLLGRLFSLCAGLYHRAPWEAGPGEMPFEVRYPEAGASRWVVVLGSGGETFGLSITDSLPDLARLNTPGEPLELLRQVSWLALSFDGPEYLAFEDLDAIEQNGWAVANERAYPAICRLGGPQADLQAPGLADLIWLEGGLAALLSFIGEPGDWRRPRRSRIAIETLDGPAWAEVLFPGLESG